MMRAVQGAGAVPAVIGVVSGALVIGLDDQQIHAMAHDARATKASTADLAATIERGATAGTTVSATLAACAVPDAGSIHVMATGGIGGVHRGWTRRPDISADLRQLATTPVCCVCSGAKSMLDVPATYESLATLAVPVIGYQTDSFPLFYSHGDEGLPLPHRFDDPASIASACQVHWRPPPAGLGQRSSVLVTQRVPPAHAIARNELEQWITEAETIARSGAQRTPDVLATLAERSGGRTLEANIALLINNATLAGRIAAALAEPGQHDEG